MNSPEQLGKKGGHTNKGAAVVSGKVHIHWSLEKGDLRTLIHKTESCEQPRDRGLKHFKLKAIDRWGNPENMFSTHKSSTGSLDLEIHNKRR